MLGVSQCDLHTATSNQHSSRCPEVAAGSVAGIHPNQRHPRGAVDRISPSRELKGRVRETYDVDFTEGPPNASLLRDYLAAAPAMPPRCASAQLSAESRSSSAGTIAGSRGARGALMSVVYGRGPFLPHHTPS